jgi:heme/copper-type cytochrome/quinol oxidase subunit 2
MKKNEKFFISFLASILFVCLFFVGVSQASAACDPPNFEQLPGGLCVPSSDVTNLSNAEADDILTNFLLWLLGIFGVIAVVAFVISGIQYLTSAGDPEQAETAKRNTLYSLLGVLIALAGWIIVNAVDQAMRGNISF